MAVTLNVDFWQINGGANTFAVVDRIMRECLALPAEDERRLLQGDTKAIRLQYLEKRAGIWQGDFVGIRTRAAAKRGDTAGHVESLDFRDNEGLCEETAFLVIPTMNLLILQRSRMGATSASVVRFLEHFDPMRGILDIMPIPTQGTMEHFNQLRDVSSITVGIARVENAQGLGGENDSVSDLLKLGAALDAPRMMLQLSVGHQWKSRVLSRESVTNFVQRLLRIQHEDPAVAVKKVLITGRNEDDERDVLDLVINRLQYNVEVDADEGRGASRATRLQALRDAYQQNRDFLHQHFEAPS
jgi:hypothetical protein